MRNPRKYKKAPSNKGISLNRRFASADAVPERVVGLPAHHPAIVENRTLFPGTVTDPRHSPRLLISGANQRKIGVRVKKGRWAGMPIYCLTLEERATCPADCHLYGQCYGNSMHWSRRHKAGSALEYLLEQELNVLQDEKPGGFVVRLHILGDLYDEAYTMLWMRWLEKFPALRIFGFTARSLQSPIGQIVYRMNGLFADRCVMRFSGTKRGVFPAARTAITLWETPTTPTVAGAVVCPAQTGKTDCCGTCGLCWTMNRDVAFIAHGRL